MRGEGRWRWPRRGLCRWLLLGLTKQTIMTVLPQSVLTSRYLNGGLQRLFLVLVLVQRQGELGCSDRLGR